jgi:ribosomal protein S18 acetylase RimI-like enzyme
VTRIAVRPLHPTHRSEIDEIVRSTGVFSSGEVAVALEVLDAGLAGDTGYELLGAFDRDRLIGYACFGATPATDRTYDLYWIAVRPDAQRTGAGSALMAEVERRLASRAARMVVVETSSREDYAPTREFYHRRGYEEAARLRDFYAAGDDRVVLSKRMHAAQGPLPAQVL